ncbi:MAG: Uma2 family endonuclease [Lachnospiraceae bacterium]|nr:Uma2 family endonuclease [Lachnospiraceae bacterium]
MTIEEMRERKRELGLTNQIIANRTGIPLSTVQKIFAGATASPRRETVRALEALLKPQGGGGYGEPCHGTRGLREAPSVYGSGAGRIRDEGMIVKSHSAAGGVIGPYTLEDYLKLPDDQRVELIDGFFYDMAAPTTIHQSIAGFLYKKFLDYVLENKGPCYPFISPVDVQLDADDKTVIQPDVLIVCDRSKYRNGRIFGAPDLIVEVLSPSSRKKDMHIKLSKYYDAGVREYWIVDPEKKMLVQYDMEHMELPAVYNCESEIPVLIWNSGCRIDLSEMFDTIGFLWETDQ